MARWKLNQQSIELAKTHDMLVTALPGQSYKKETFHKVSTTQVTGEALKKVSVGGKGGFGSQGDARDQKKEVESTARVMVMSGPAQAAFDFNALLDEKIVGWEERVVPFTGHKDWVPIKAPVPPRDYDEFAHSGSWDASDNMRMAEFYLEGEQLERCRATYDELCGYKDAWKYLGYDGAEHRRYRITIVNDLNEPQEHTHTAHIKDGKIVVTKGFTKKKEQKGAWPEEASHRHHNDIFKALNQYYYVHGEDEEYLKDWMLSNRNDHAAYVIWRLDQYKVYPEQTTFYEIPVVEPSEEFLAMKDAAEVLERKRKFLAFEKAPKLEDWKMVYKWELTKQGKTMFSNEKI